jgi:hypothetical protein
MLQQPETNNSNNNKRSNSSYLMQYAGLATQLLVALGIAVFIGLKADQWFQISFPLCAWLLPLLALCTIFYKILKDTSKKP